MKQRLIITDDDPGIQDVFRLIFERAGYEVTIFPNGDPLLNNQFEVPHLFILDKQLSGVDGLDICRHLKSQERTQHIPVILLSASPQIAKLAVAAGADAALEKPFRQKELLELVAKYLRAA